MDWGAAAQHGWARGWAGWAGLGWVGLSWEGRRDERREEDGGGIIGGERSENSCRFCNNSRKDTCYDRGRYHFREDMLLTDGTPTDEPPNITGILFSLDEMLERGASDNSYRVRMRGCGLDPNPLFLPIFTSSTSSVRADYSCS